MNLVPIGELVEKVDKLDPRSDFGDGQFTYVDIGSVSQKTKRIEGPQTIPCEDAPSRARQVIAVDDVLVSTVRPNLNAVAQVPTEYDGTIASTGFSVLRPKAKELDSSYLYHWVRTGDFVNKMMLLATGQSYPAVSDKIVKSSKIPLPPLEEQKRIAGILDQADALRRLRTHALDKLNTLGQAIFHEMFGDPRRNPMGWPVVEFGISVENCDSQRVPIKQADRDKRSGPYPYYGSVGIIDDIDDFRFEGEHLLVSEDGKHLQSRTRPIACIATGKFWVNNHAHVLRDNGQADLYFLRTFLETSSIENHISGIDQIKLNRKSMDKIPVPLPPRAEQDRFRAMILSVEKQQLKMEEHSDQAGKLFASLQHRAFCGEL